MYRFIHDEANRTVYRVPKVPEVIENIKKGRLVSWIVCYVIDVTRADNVQQKHGWRYQVRLHIRQHYDSTYSKDEAISYFLGHTPTGIDIDENTYKFLNQKYYDLALNNRL